MEVRKVEKAKPPAYPDKEASLRDPTLLLNTPERWKRNAAACAALVVTGALLMTGCSDEEEDLVFNHGRGICSKSVLSKSMIRTGLRTMGMVATPVLPIVLDEEEAFSIIKEEAEQAGLHFVQSEKTLEGIQVFKKDFPEGFKLDGYDEDKDIAFEYVSATDAFIWKEESPTAGSDTVVDIRACAHALADSLQNKTGETIVAVFYDPVCADKGYEKYKDIDVSELYNNEINDLRAQVRDFIAWLKAQGII